MIGLLGNITGLRLIESRHCVERKQIRFLRCNKKKWKRLKKFNKNPRNFIKVPIKKVFVTGNTVICHPVVAGDLRRELRKSGLM